MFYDPENTNKKERVGQKLEKLILAGELSDNISGMKYCMREGCEPKLFSDVVKRMEAEKKITRFGDLNFTSNRIHQLKNKKYRIRVVE